MSNIYPVHTAGQSDLTSTSDGCRLVSHFEDTAVLCIVLYCPMLSDGGVGGGEVGEGGRWGFNLIVLT